MKEKKKENLILKFIKFILGIFKTIFLFFQALLGSKTKKKKIEIKPSSSNNIQVKKNSTASNTNFEDTINALKQNPESLQEKLVNEIKTAFFNEIESKSPEITKEEEKILETLNQKIIPELHTKIAKEQQTENLENQIKKEVKEALQEILINEQMPLSPKLEHYKEEIKQESILKKTKESLEKDIQKIYLKEIKQEELYITKIEEELKNEIIQKIETVIEDKIKEGKIPNQVVLEEEIKNEIQEYFIDSIRNGKIKPFEIDEKIKKYVEKIIEENHRITLREEEKEKEIPTIEEKTEKLTTMNVEEVKTPQEEPQKVQVKDEIKKSEPKKEEQRQEEKPKTLPFENINFSTFEKASNTIESLASQEMNKEELEDKEYENVEEKIDALLMELNHLETKNIDEFTKQKIKTKAKSLEELKRNLNADKEKGIEHEKENLNQKITLEELNGLKKEIKNLYIEHQIDVNNEVLAQTKGVESLTEQKQIVIKKTLLTKKLKKASRYARFPFLLSLPFIRNKYFYYLTGGLLVHHQLNIFGRCLNNQQVEYTEEELSQIETGAHALEQAIYVSNQNILKLENLTNAALAQYPELRENKEFMSGSQELKENLLHTETKLLKKQQVIEKYHIKNLELIRKLKKKKNR